MSRSLKRFFSCKIILSSSVPSSREGFDVVQLCAVMMGRPASSVMFSCEAGLSSLCTLVTSCMVVVICHVVLGQVDCCG